MVVYLRPYHLFAVIRQLATGRTEEDFNGIPEITRKIRNNSGTGIEVVRVFDDACNLCAMRKKSPNGCIWGEKYICPSAKNIRRAREVDKSNDEIIRDLGVWVGTRMEAIDILRLAARKRPFHYSKNKPWQNQYESGIKILFSRDVR